MVKWKRLTMAYLKLKSSLFTPRPSNYALFIHIDNIVIQTSIHYLAACLSDICCICWGEMQWNFSRPICSCIIDQNVQEIVFDKQLRNLLAK